MRPARGARPYAAFTLFFVSCVSPAVEGIVALEDAGQGQGATLPSPSVETATEMAPDATAADVESVDASAGGGPADASSPRDAGSTADADQAPDMVEASLADAGPRPVLDSPGYGSVAFEELEDSRLSDIAPGGPHLHLLADRGLQLGLHWKSELLDDAARFAIVEAARGLGVKVHVWLTLPEGSADDHAPGSPRYTQTGYFPNSTNFAAWIEKATALMELWKARGHTPSVLLVDLEMRKERLLEFARLTSDSTTINAQVALLKQNIDRTRHAQAIGAFRAFVEDAHARGWKVVATTLLPIADDYADNDDDLRQAFNVPLDDAPQSADAIAWDAVELQIQRTLYTKTVPLLTPFFTYDYARLARELFGEKAYVGLGLTHAGIAGLAPIYESGDDLRRDVEAAHAAGIPAQGIGVYSFYGIYSRPPTSQWMQVPNAARAPDADLGTPLVHAGFQTYDALLDGS
ncbi:MAG: hypothetical protein RL385_1208 [Pseudomonadota bacterium]|jgi:hypothetical protein